jgi:hypothetical protein
MTDGRAGVAARGIRYEIGHAVSGLDRGFANLMYGRDGARRLGAMSGRPDRPSVVLLGAVGDWRNKRENRSAASKGLAIPDDRVIFDVQGHAPATGGQDSSQDLS